MDIPKGFKPKQGIEEKTNQLLEGASIKQDEEELQDRNLEVYYENIAPEELKRCKYPENSLAYISIGFRDKKENKYYVDYYASSNRSQPTIVIVKERFGTKATFKEEVKEIEKFQNLVKDILQDNEPTTKPNTANGAYFVVDADMSRNIILTEAAYRIHHFYEENFKNVVIRKVKFRPVSQEDIEFSKLPSKKIKKQYPLR